MKAEIFILFIIISLKGIAQPDWQSIKDTTMPYVAISNEYSKPFRQPLSVGGWEDGVFITRDGLNLYCIYLPVDFFSFTFSGNSDQTNFSPYKRGPTLGMDLITNPVGADEWLQGDILYSHRNSLTDSFRLWTLSNLARPVWTEGAVQMIQKNDSIADLFVYTSNETFPYKGDILLIKDAKLNPLGVGSVLPAPVTTEYKEDNPHIERLDSVNLVLFFDSDEKNDGVGKLDIWYSTSSDNGITWINPLQVSSINTTSDEQQPHLFKQNDSDWYLYYTGTNPITSKVEIYRAKQSITGDWNSWINKELVIGAGNALAVGEPSLTKDGDISFVVIYEASDGTSSDKFDADPWFLPKLKPVSQNDNKYFNKDINLSIFPNPLKDNAVVTIDIINGTDYQLAILNIYGQEVKKISSIKTDKIYIHREDLLSGLYFIKLTNSNKLVGIKKLIIE